MSYLVDWTDDALEPLADVVDPGALARLSGLGLTSVTRDEGGEEQLALTPRGRLLGGGVTAELLA